jgi:hypothetical protein
MQHRTLKHETAKGNDRNPGHESFAKPYFGDHLGILDTFEDNAPEDVLDAGLVSGVDEGGERHSDYITAGRAAEQPREARVRIPHDTGFIQAKDPISNLIEKMA